MFLYLLFFEIFCLQITRKKEHFSPQIEQKPIVRIQKYKVQSNKTKNLAVSFLTEKVGCFISIKSLFDAQKRIKQVPYYVVMLPTLLPLRSRQPWHSTL